MYTQLGGIGPAPIDPGPDLVCRMAARSFAQVVIRLLQAVRNTKYGDTHYCIWKQTGSCAVHEGPEKWQKQRRSNHGMDEDAGGRALERLLS